MREQGENMNTKKVLKLALVAATSVALMGCPAVYRKSCNGDQCHTTVLGF
jgi:hypothetical protein